MKHLTQITTQNGIIVDLPDATMLQVKKACEELKKSGHPRPYTIKTGYPAYCPYCTQEYGESPVSGLRDYPNNSVTCVHHAKSMKEHF
jgi:hypothetical protein